MLTLDACPVCRGTQRTLACEFNGMVLLDQMRDSPLARYDYHLCHDCGVVAADRRPDNDEYRYMLENFNENLGRAAGYERVNPLASVGPLADSDRDDLRARIARGWLLSEEDQPPADKWLPQLLTDRLNHAAYLDILASAVDLQGARVLEIRSKTGWMLDALRRGWNADVSAMAAFESLRFVIEETYDIPAELIDFYDFEIPFEGQFDVIVAKHMVTHVVDPDAFLRVVRERLRPGGHLYLYTENDDANMARAGKDIFREMKAFHFQNMDVGAFGRTLRRHGFEPTFIRHIERSAMACLARPSADARFTPMTESQRDERIALYRDWRRESLLRAPATVRRAFDGEVGTAEVLAARGRRIAKVAVPGVRALIGGR